MRYIKFVVAATVSVCLLMSGCDTGNVVAENQPIKRTKVKNAVVHSTGLTSAPVAEKGDCDKVSCDNGSCDNGSCDKCEDCTSLSPAGNNNFVPATVKSKRQNEQFVAQLRVWNDYEGVYSTKAELVSVAIDSRTVKLLKDNGVTINVPISQLSRHDKNYVNAFIDQCYAENNLNNKKIVDNFND